MDRQPRYGKDEHAQLGEAIYDRDLRAKLEPGNHGRIVAIDVDTGESEVADNVISATTRLLARLPDAQIWCVRVGHRRGASLRSPLRKRTGMISGTVTDSLEAVLSLAVRPDDEQWQQVEAIIDTGFTGFLTLPPSVIESLKLPWLCRQRGMLADGRLHTFDVYTANIIWGEEERLVEIEAAEIEPLVGMSLLAGNLLTIEVRGGGTVAIESLP